MNLLENVVAALLFSAVASVWLGIWSLGLTAEARRAERQRSGDQIDAELTALDLRLRDVAATLPPGSDCASASRQLAALVVQPPPPSGLRRELSLTGPAGREMATDTTTDPSAESTTDATTELGLLISVGTADASPHASGEGATAEERRRWFSPAALGVCGGWEEADATPH